MCVHRGCREVRDSLGRVRQSVRPRACNNPKKSRAKTAGEREREKVNRRYTTLAGHGERDTLSRSVAEECGRWRNGDSTAQLHSLGNTPLVPPNLSVRAVRAVQVGPRQPKSPESVTRNACVSAGQPRAVFSVPCHRRRANVGSCDVLPRCDLIPTT